jgi:hypothetical protein
VTPIPLEAVKRRLLYRGGHRPSSIEYAMRGRRVLRSRWNWRDHRPKDKR